MNYVGRILKPSDLAEIKNICTLNYVSKVDIRIEKGFTSVVYSDNVILNLIADEMSYGLVDQNDSLAGYILTCSQEGFIRAFNKTLEEELKPYNIEMLPTDGYGAQVCMIDGAKKQGNFAQLMTGASELALQKEINAFYAEIFRDNITSQKAVHANGWHRTGWRTGNPDIFGDSRLLIERFGLVEWYLYRKELNLIHS